MKRLLLLAMLVIASPVYPQQNYQHDVVLTDITKPQPGYAAVPPETVSRIATQEQSLTDIKERLAKIDDSIKSIQVDLRSLMDTNVIVHFVMQCLTVLVPGLLIAAFTVWLAKTWKTANPKRKRSGHGTIGLG